MLVKRNLSLFVALECALALSANEIPYAVCAHLSRPGEFETRIREMSLVRDIGIGSVRTDFDWKYVEPERGKWTFDHLDKLLDDAEKMGVSILPILDYEVPWAVRPWNEESIGLWRQYVRNVVSRYRGRCRVWEVWNEQNATQGKKHLSPTPAEYVRLLRAAYEEIKSVDPDLRVAIGGFAGVPFDYIEGVYRSGGRDAFDIMNVHPYQRAVRAEGGMEKQYADLRALMARYEDAAKPVWATEIGLMTSEAGVQEKGFLAAALRKVDPKRRWRILHVMNGTLPDRNFRRHDTLKAFLDEEMKGTGWELEICLFEDFRARLASGGHDAVLLPLTEEYPADAADDLVRFVAAGGTLVEIGGMAFFKPMVRAQDGSWRKGSADGAALTRRFRFRNAAWFTDKTLPKDPRCRAALGFEYEGTLPRLEHAETRFFVPDGLKGGDAFIPLMAADASDGRAAASAAWIRYGSDMKGNLVLAGFLERNLYPFNEDDQGVACARQLNLAYALGYEKVFWYEFLSCSGFGIVNKEDFSPRPAYRAYRAFIEARPAGSVRVEGKWKTDDGDVYFPSWRLPNGATAGALWSVSGKGAAPDLPELRRAVWLTDYLGRELKELPKTLPDTPIYWRTAPKPKSAPFVAYRSFLKQGEMTGTFARMGVKTRCFFAANTVNGRGSPYCEYPPIWTGEGEYDFSALDDQVADLLKASPDARLLCIIDLNTPPWVVRKFWDDSFHHITHLACDPLWRVFTSRWLRDFIAYAEKHHGDRIDGYILSGGGTSEWYEIDYGVASRRKNAAWRTWCAAQGVDHGAAVPSESELGFAKHKGEIYDPATERAKIDYWRFHSSVTADAVLHFAREARLKLSPEKSLGVFFGYALESHDLQASFAHLDYRRVFASPDIDFVISPGNYSDRGIGGTAGSQLPQGTAMLFGKRLVHEIDFAPHGNGSWPTPWRSAADDLAGNARESAFALVNHASSWWFDMWGGFYEDSCLRDRIGRLKEIADGLSEDESPSDADVLFVCDPWSTAYVNERIAESESPSWAFTPAATLRLRNALGRSGLVADIHSFDDLRHLDLSRYRMICLPQLIEVTPERGAFLRERVCRDGRTVLWCGHPGLSDGRTLDAARTLSLTGLSGRAGAVETASRGDWTSVLATDCSALTPERLRAIGERAGCWLALEGPGVVFANRRLMAVHVAQGGELAVRLKRKVGKVTDLLTGRVLGERTDSVRVPFDTPDTRLLRLD